jgi:hypothetical protein
MSASQVELSSMELLMKTDTGTDGLVVGKIHPTLYPYYAVIRDGPWFSECVHCRM